MRTKETRPEIPRSQRTAPEVKALYERVGKMRLRTKDTRPEIPRSQRTAPEVKARVMEELCPPAAVASRPVRAAVPKRPEVCRLGEIRP